MAPTGRHAASATDATARLREAPFVSAFVRGDGASVAAAGVLARGLDDCGVPFRIRPVEPGSTPDGGSGDPDTVTVLIGCDAVSEAVRVETPTDAAETVRALDADPDPALALAGRTLTRGPDESGGERPDTDLPLDPAVERQPGIAAPVDDPVVGAAYSTLVHGPFSGDPSTAARTVPADADGRTAASAVAMAATADAPPRAAETVSRAITPLTAPTAPVPSVEGLADTLDAAARLRPGAAVALALGGRPDAAVEAWRAHGERAHAALRSATVEDRSGIDCLRVDESSSGRDPVPVETVARLHHRYRSTAAATVVREADRVGVAAADVGGVLDALRGATGGTGDAAPGGRSGRARIDAATDPEIVTDAVRGAA